jgi:prepilin-type N-terminal cleavage/methylation domain-containing protein
MNHLCKSYTSPSLLWNKRVGAARPSEAFTLIELMLVMAIMSILLAVGISGMSFMGGNFTGHLYNVSDVLRLARTSAVSQDTYVQVGFCQDPNDANTLVVGVSVGNTGDATDFTSTPPLTHPLTKLTRLGQVKLENATTANFPALEAPAVSVYSDSTSSYSFTQTAVGQAYNFNSVIQFSPTGEATTATSTNAPAGTQWISFDLKPALGLKTDEAVIQVSYISGEVQVFRP